ncbi:MAG: hypothetical protein JXB14_05490 [Candidatus Altiarchaeota archaeon]|nr:hypothetical protein [Candidatus Altiarchaeota archaeon]
MFRGFAAVIILALVVANLYAALVFAVSDCPANRSNIGPYNKVTVLPKYKIVNKAFTVYVVKVDDHRESPLSGRSVEISFKEGNVYKVVTTLKTDRNGIVQYTPDKIGTYKIVAATKAVTFEVRGSTIQIGEATCGNEICEEDEGENADNCPEDCTECGDAVCEGLETKESCPDDCEICGDGECDPSEYDRGQCYCPEDCIVCGDEFCDKNNGEDDSLSPTYCPTDCGDSPEPPPNGDNKGISLDALLNEYWWVLAILAFILFIAVRKPIFRRLKRSKRAKGGRDKPAHQETTWARDDEHGRTEGDDREVEDIILGLMDSGVSEKHILKKMEEFGLDKKEAKELVDKAKKLR